MIRSIISIELIPVPHFFLAAAEFLEGLELEKEKKPTIGFSFKTQQPKTLLTKSSAELQSTFDPNSHSTSDDVLYRTEGVQLQRLHEDEKPEGSEQSSPAEEKEAQDSSSSTPSTPTSTPSTPEERKITEIPKEKEKLYLFPIDWDSLKTTGAGEAEIPKFLTAQLEDLFGEADEDVIQFLLDLLLEQRSPPESVEKELTDLLSPPEAEKFTLDLWRRLAELSLEAGKVASSSSS